MARTKQLLEIINKTRLILNKRIEEAKKAGQVDKELCDLDNDLLDFQETIMDENP